MHRFAPVGVSSALGAGVPITGHGMQGIIKQINNCGTVSISSTVIEEHVADSTAQNRQNKLDEVSASERDVRFGFNRPTIRCVHRCCRHLYRAQAGRPRWQSCQSPGAPTRPASRRCSSRQVTQTPTLPVDQPCLEFGLSHTRLRALAAPPPAALLNLAVHSVGAAALMVLLVQSQATRRASSPGTGARSSRSRHPVTMTSTALLTRNEWRVMVASAELGALLFLGQLLMTVGLESVSATE
jgi:hypothetical protein